MLCTVERVILATDLVGLVCMAMRVLVSVNYRLKEGRDWAIKRGRWRRRVERWRRMYND